MQHGAEREDLLADLARAQAREAATRDILNVISQSREDEAPVFRTILDRAQRLCGAQAAGLQIVTPSGTHLRTMAGTSLDRGIFASGEEFALDRPLGMCIAVREARVVHIPDLKDTDLYRAGDATRRRLVDDLGARTQLAVPLIGDGAAFGNINLTRNVARPFTDDEISLVETFAAQAVIAIQNVRQFRELQTRLEREAATREVLEVISTSREDQNPVFDAILENASRLCKAPLAFLTLANEDRTMVTVPAHRGTRSAFGSILDGFVEPITRTELVAVRPVADGRIVREDDIMDDDLYRSGDPRRRQMVDVEGARSVLSVPLMSKDTPIGAIILYRREVSPFDEDDVSLIRSFAAQAVIAIQNVRQFREVQERLERERASAEVLDVISRSRDDEFPVFDIILRNAGRLCNAATAMLQLTGDGVSFTQMAVWAEKKAGSYPNGSSFVPDPEMAVPVSVRERRVVQIGDLAEDDLYRGGDPVRVRMVDDEGIRTFMSVPLLQGDRAIGAIALSRRDVRPFSRAEISLVETFAAQATIAIENVRQFREVQDRLAREQASAEILEAISQSRDDEAPVFETVLRNAWRLCNAVTAALMLGRPEDEHLTLAALVHADPARNLDATERIAQVNRVPMKMDPRVHVSAAAICEGTVQNIADLKDTESYRSGEPSFRIMVDEQGHRSILSVPLFDARGTLGAINLHRSDPGLFRDDEIALVETFAAQAVIAIENVRQFREVQERLEREIASRNILQVISQSREDEGPVFQEILTQAATLCRAGMAGLVLPNEAGTHVFVAALHGTFKVFKPSETGFPIEADVGVTQSIREGRVIHRRSLQDIPEGQNRQDMADEGIKTILWVPLMKDDIAIGSIGLFRLKEEAFSDDEIALVKMFCSQATIAIENARQFRDLETLNAELGTRVEAQVGEIERMGRLKRFLPAAVADAVVSSGSDRMLSSHRALLGVLFCDMRGFTAFCETAEPEETIEVLQTYHEEMGKLINAHGAGVDHRSGDGIMVLFNDPIPCDDPAGDAVRLAVAMRARMAELCRTWKRMGYRLGFGVGISLGYATVGMVGFEGRFDYTASGTAINLASRLCDEAEDGEILLSPRAGIAVEDAFGVQSRGVMNLKGLREPLEVFRLAGGGDGQVT